ncbi:MAG: PaREP1 family protein [Desulfurococcaceae archaeon]|nr:PaREP1 family protein [Desulfurococcaceae archaeon]
MCKEVGSTDIFKYLEFVKKFLVKGRKLIDKDFVQVSKKLYKVVEEVVKILIITLNLEETRKVIKKSR